MKKLSLLLTLFSTVFSLVADEAEQPQKAFIKAIDESELNSSMLDISAMPSSIIGGAVNVVTGNYCDNVCDFHIPGANPLSSVRSFNSSATDMAFAEGWNLNLTSHIILPNSQNGNRKAILKDRGACLYFIEPKKNGIMQIHERQLNFGITNCGQGAISSRTNIKNRVLIYRKSCCKLYGESGEVLLYDRFKIAPDADMYRVREQILPNGNFLTYAYNSWGDLTRVTAHGEKGNYLSHVEWLHPGNFKENPEIQAKSADGSLVRYRYKRLPSRDKNNPYSREVITKVTSDRVPEVAFEYRSQMPGDRERMVKKAMPQNRFLQVQYYEQGCNNVGPNKVVIGHKRDSRVGRVAALYAPVGMDETPIRTWSFTYDLSMRKEKGWPIGGSADVKDALGRRKTYWFSKQQRLTAIDHYLGNGSLYRQERINWSKSGKENSYLQALGLVGQNDELIFRRTYLYDKQGNVLKETLWGNLTGNCHTSLSWETFHRAESCSKTFGYNLQGLLAHECDGYRTVTYKYVPHTDKYAPDTDLLELKLVYDASKRIRERHHYIYDSNKVLIRETIDDGNSPDITNLSGVTEQRIKIISPTKTFPIGLPADVRECVRDLASGQIVLVTRNVNTYSLAGKLLSQQVYDASNKLRFTKTWRYDSHGKVVEEVDALGQITTYKYDQNDNCIQKQTPDSRFYVAYTYDYSNRLIKEEKVLNGASGKRYLVNSYGYDYLGNRTSVTDRYGNTTKFEYDEFSRLVKKSSPPTINSFGKLEHSIDKVAYDRMNNPTLKVDSNGRKIKLKYTAWGKPYEKVNPDNTVENFIYSADGTLIKSIDANGIQTVYSYDYNKRKIKEEKFSSSGESLSIHKWKYNAFHLINDIEPSGRTTTYSYDSAGRVSMVRKGELETKYKYDSLGRKSETWEHCGKGDYRRTICKYDHLDRLVRETIEDTSNNRYSSKSWTYNASGNCISEIIHDNESDSRIETEFDIDDRPLRIVQPDGNQICYEYIDDFANEYGQTVAYVKETSSQGDQYIKIYDTRGRLSLEERLDLYGALLQRATYLYDGEGNLLCRNNHVVVEGKVKKEIKTLFSYDSKNQEVQVIEAAGYSTQKTTFKEYHQNGQLANVVKPSGVVLSYGYDGLNRLISLSSSDGTVDYSYAYDINNNIIEAVDNIKMNSTLRAYDKNNRMIEETLATGVVISYKYDALSRILEVALPDHSTIHYDYDAAHLRSVSRNINDQIYKTTYTYKLSGRINALEMANGIGTLQYQYDNSLRTISMESPFHSIEIPKDGYDCHSNLVTIAQNDAVGSATSHYSYDGLQNLSGESGLATNSYAFDSRHNRIGKNNIAYKVNALNQLNTQGDTSYQYDANGNLMQDAKPDEEKRYQYDALDRLVAVFSENEKIEYFYDAFNRRLQKTAYIKTASAWEKDSSISFFFQADFEIGSCDENGCVIEARTLGMGITGEIGAAVLLEIEGKAYVPIHDLRGNITGIVDVQTGQLAECYRYSAYGEEQIFDQAGTLKLKALSPWRFSSKRVDSETGWIYYGQRYYDPSIGRWTAPDPLGFKDGHNIYCFVSNRPMKYLDPNGCYKVNCDPRLCDLFADKLSPLWSYEFNQNLDLFNGGSSFESLEFSSSHHYVGETSYQDMYINFTNGMGNNLRDALASAKIVSEIANGHRVNLVHNATFGNIRDLKECDMGLDGIMTTPTYLIAFMWMAQAQNPNARILHIAHSQGMIHVMNAATLVPEEVRKRITIIGIAPGGHVNEGDFEYSMHYESEKDFVPGLHKKRCGRDFNENTQILKPHENAPWFDHTFSSPTYERPLRREIGRFINKYGKIK